MNLAELEARIEELKATYLKVYPGLTKMDFIEASENVGNDDSFDSDWLYAFACHIEDVAERRNRK